MPSAVLDLGSNSFALLIVTDNYQSDILKKNQKVNISRSLSYNKNLDEQAMEDGWKCLKHFQSLILKYKANTAIVVATAAFRKAHNSDIFIQKAQNILNTTIKILNGKDEANYIYQATKRHKKHNQNNKNNTVIDIGGGSTEIVCGNNEKILFATSIEIGVVSIGEQFFKKTQLHQQDFNKAKNKITKHLNQHLQNQLPNCINYLGTSGAINSLKDLGIFFNIELQNNKITTQYLNQIIIKLQNIKVAEINLNDLPKKLNYIIPAGVIILASLLELLQITELTLCPATLCDGLVVSINN